MNNKRIQNPLDQPSTTGTVLDNQCQKTRQFDDHKERNHEARVGMATDETENKQLTRQEHETGNGNKILS